MPSIAHSQAHTRPAVPDHRLPGRRRQSLLDALKVNICGRVHRELVPGTLEVYPLKEYGAVEIGVHRFTHPGIGQSVGQARFVTIWRSQDGVWTMTRVVSFDHGPVTK